MRVVKEIQIYMSSRAQEIFLAFHGFYVEKIEIRVLGKFDKMDEEAKRVTEQATTAFDACR